MRLTFFYFNLVSCNNDFWQESPAILLKTAQQQFIQFYYKNAVTEFPCCGLGTTCRSKWSYNTLQYLNIPLTFHIVRKLFYFRQCLFLIYAWQPVQGQIFMFLSASLFLSYLREKPFPTCSIPAALPCDSNSSI